MGTKTGHRIIIFPFFQISKNPFFQRQDMSRETWQKSKPHFGNVRTIVCFYCLNSLMFLVPLCWRKKTRFYLDSLVLATAKKWSFPTNQSPRQLYSTTASLLHSMLGHFLKVTLNFWFEMRNWDPTFWQEWICCSGWEHSVVKANLNKHL